MRDYEMRFTHSAETFAAAHGGRGTLEEKARGEVAELLGDSGNAEHPMEDWFFFHCFEVGDQAFIMLARHDHVLLDTALFEEGPTVTEGPLAGMKTSMPRAESED
jgi:hypothetical protein